MAGDWIKMRSDLQTHPKVVRMASALKADRLRVVGGLHAVWSLFDMHSEDGVLDGYTRDALDESIGFSGFSEAMIKVGWLSTDGESLMVPRFDEHNGQSAKRRSQETQRKREARKESAPDADKMRSREEKRREEVKDLCPPPADEADSNSSEIQGVLEYLNLKTGSKYRPVPSNTRLIAGRLKEGFTLDECKAVVDAKVDQWGGDEKMEQFLRPGTLFNATNFAQYAGQLGSSPTKQHTGEAWT
jgi:uncharacterized phage protein (TIGR02220 family)